MNYVGAKVKGPRSRQVAGVSKTGSGGFRPPDFNHEGHKGHEGGHARNRAFTSDFVVFVSFVVRRLRLDRKQGHAPLSLLERGDTYRVDLSRCFLGWPLHAIDQPGGPRARPAAPADLYTNSGAERPKLA